MKGIITHIQRMSIHDGPGIRSTIFMKGCNLRCQWCHNPETFSSLPEIEWIKSKCISCQSCVKSCKSEALSLINGKVEFNKSKCTSCFDCIPVCFSAALQKVGMEVTPNEVFLEIQQDFPFFKNSDGGITISGGEPMLQQAFITETFKLFRQAGIHTAIETNFTFPWKRYETVLPFIDMVMVDVKLIDDNLHTKWTGGSNKHVIQNILTLDKTDKPYIIRTPVVPQVNADEEQMDQIIHFVSGLKNLVKFEMLPFHSLATPKYHNLGIPNPFEKVNNVLTAELHKYNQLLKKYKTEF